MSTLRKIGGQIQAVSLHHSAQWGISVILGAYLSLQLVGAGGLIGYGRSISLTCRSVALTPPLVTITGRIRASLLSAIRPGSAGVAELADAPDSKSGSP